MHLQIISNCHDEQPVRDRLSTCSSSMWNQCMPAPCPTCYISVPGVVKVWLRLCCS